MQSTNTKSTLVSVKATYCRDRPALYNAPVQAAEFLSMSILFLSLSTEQSPTGCYDAHEDSIALPAGR